MAETVFNPRFPLGGSALFLTLLLLAACAPATAQTPPPPPPSLEGDRGTIQVTGQAQIRVPADAVSLAFTVETEAESAREASASNAGRMETVLGALRGLSLDGMEIETYGYNLLPEYRAPTREEPGRRTISGYRAMNNIRVTVPDVEAAGEILDTGIAAGANRVANLQFQARDTREARLQAIRDAVMSAREEAEAMAEAMGVRLGRPLEVRGGASPGEPRVMARGIMAEDAFAAGTPIEGGHQTVSASVTIVYRILEWTR